MTEYQYLEFYNYFGKFRELSVQGLFCFNHIGVEQYEK